MAADVELDVGLHRSLFAQSNYTNTKLKAWFRRLLCHPARKWSEPIVHLRTYMGASNLWVQN